MSKEEFITEEEITKALSDLELDTELESDDIIKSDDNDEEGKKKHTNAKVEGGDDEEDDEEDNDEEDNDEEDDEEDNDEEKSYKAVKQGKMTYYQKGDKYYSKGDNGKYTSVSSESMKKAGWKSSVVTKSEDDEFSYNSEGKTREEVEADGGIEKGLTDDDFQKGLEVNPILNRLNETLNTIADSQDKKSRATGTILKGVMGQISDLSEQVAKIAGTSNGRKSAINSKPIERFSKGEGDDSKVLSIANHRGQILEVMDNLTFKDDKIDNDMSKAMTYFEANSVMSNATALRIEKEAGIRITL